MCVTSAKHIKCAINDNFCRAVVGVALFNCNSVCPSAVLTNKCHHNSYLHVLRTLGKVSFYDKSVYKINTMQQETPHLKCVFEVIRL